MCSPPRGWAALPYMFGQEGRYIMKKLFCGKTCVMQLSMFAGKYGDSVSIRVGGCYPYGELKIRHTVIRPSGESIDSVRFFCTEDAENSQKCIPLELIAPLIGIAETYNFKWLLKLIDTCPQPKNTMEQILEEIHHKREMAAERVSQYLICH